MHNKLRNSLVISALAICGVVAGNSGAMAAPVDSAPIPFEGTVTNMCAFGTPTAGAFGDISSPDQNYIVSVEGSGFQAAYIRLTCNGDAGVEVSDFQEVSKPTGMNLDGAAVSVESSYGGSYWDTFDGSGNHTVTGPFDENLIVNMGIGYTTPVKPGVYSYTTKLTATPQ
ncbi:MAG: hypothetical protein KME17_29215 [Cyanosarcina radialis HA8281-LM2]|jgi:hypothetical protein|nr:hypothetical protein [Cyanosarcina radialis HA8281-LM2]